MRIKKSILTRSFALAGLLMGLLACNLTTAVPITPAPTSAPATLESASVGLLPSPSPTPSATPSPTATIAVQVVAALPQSDGKSFIGGGSAVLPPPVYRPPVFTVSHRLPGPACSITPGGHTLVNIRSGPSTTSAVIGALPPGTWVIASFRDAGGWYRISLPGSPVDGGWVFGGVVHLTMPCTCAAHGVCSPVVHPPPVIIHPPPVVYPPYHPPPVIIHPPVIVPTSTTIPIYYPPTETPVP